MRQNFTAIKFGSKLIIIVFLLLNASFDITAQVGVLDTIYKSDNSINWLQYSNGYTYWIDSPLDDTPVIYREHEGVVESRTLPEAYSDCNDTFSNTFIGLYAYGGFLYIRLGTGSGTGTCKQGFIWEGNTLIEDPYDIGSICAVYENYLLSQDDKIFDIDTRTSQTFDLEDLGDAQYRYSSTNICAMNDTFINIRAGKFEKPSDTFVGEAIVQYNWRDDVFEELFLTTDFLVIPRYPLRGARVIFTGTPPGSVGDSIKLYLYDGEAINLITQRFITNSSAFDYLGGVSYVSDDSLFYWEDGYTAVLSDEVFRATTDGCKIAWFRGNGTDTKLNVSDGLNYTEIPISGNQIQSDLILTEETSFLFKIRSLAGVNHIIRGDHGVSCSGCANSDVQIAEDDPRSYLNTRNITSEAIINTGNTVYKAQESISLIPGFSVENGFGFAAKVEDCDEEVFLANSGNERVQVAALPIVYKPEVAEKIGVSQSAQLEQNVPNPFSATTRIDYFIPTDAKNAKISIFNAMGLLINAIDIEHFGDGRVDVQMNGLANGIYHYVLEMNGEVIERKKMILIK